MSDDFASTPPPPPKFGVSMLAGQVCIVVPHKLTVGVATQFGIKDVLDVSVVVLSGQYAGQEYLGEQFMTSDIVNQLRGQVGQVLLGRIALAPGAKPGSMGPLVLADAGPEGTSAAEKWKAENPGRIGYLKTEGTRIAEAKAADRAQQPQGNAAGYGYTPGYGQQGQLQFAQPAAAGGNFPPPPAPVSEPPF